MGLPDKTRREKPTFRWTKIREEAALSLAQDELTDQQIADNAGISRASLSEWKKNPDFAARVDAYVAEFRARIRRRGLAIVENRVHYLQERHHKLRRVIDERAAAPEMQNVPGGKTGLLVRTIRSIGAGTAAKEVEEFAVDTGTLKELREHEKQAAQELGQWADQYDFSGEFRFGPIILDRSTSDAAPAETPKALPETGAGNPEPGPVHMHRSDDEGGQDGRVSDLDSLDGVE